MIAIGAATINSTGAGSAVVFERINDNWIQTWLCFASPRMPGDEFGIGLGVSEDSLLIGAPGKGGLIGGSVYAYRRNSDGWELEQRLVPDDLGAPKKFGRSISLEGSRVLIGAPSDSTHLLQAGAAYLFERTNGRWVQASKVLAVSANQGDSLGKDVELRPSEAFVSATGVDMPALEAGAVLVYELPLNVVQYCSCGHASAPCSNEEVHGGCANSSGQGSVLQGCGSSSVSKDTLEMEARWLPLHVLGIVLMGSSSQQVLFGDGHLCFGPGSTGVFRFAPQDSGRAGVITLGPGIAAYTHANFPLAGQIHPGQTWYFQAWYRDPAGPCGTGFNLTNGLKVDFKP